MTDYVHFCQKRNHRTNCSRQTGGVSLNLMVLTGFILGIIVYLFQANSVVSMGLELRDFRQELQEKQQALEELEARATFLQSIPVLEESLRGKEMVQSDNVSYLTIGGENTFALER